MFHQLLFKCLGVIGEISIILFCYLIKVYVIRLLDYF